MNALEYIHAFQHFADLLQAGQPLPINAPVILRGGAAELRRLHVLVDDYQLETRWLGDDEDTRPSTRAKRE